MVDHRARATGPMRPRLLRATRAQRQRGDRRGVDPVDRAGRARCAGACRVRTACPRVAAARPDRTAAVAARRPSAGDASSGRSRSSTSWPPTSASNIAWVMPARGVPSAPTSSAPSPPRSMPRQRRGRNRSPASTRFAGVEVAGAEFHGNIDRIDLMPDGGLRVTDFKTGAKFSLRDVLDGGRRLQLPLYARAADHDRVRAHRAHVLSTRRLPRRATSMSARPRRSPVRCRLIRQ